MVGSDGRAKVLDFGLARGTPPEAAEVDRGTRTHTAPGTVMGTPAYMAPELLRGQTADAASDIWALGVMLYELASGGRPFKGTTAFEVSAAILQQPVPRASRIPAPLHQIIDRCLAKDPHDRYTGAHEISSALAALPAESSLPTDTHTRSRDERAGCIRHALDSCSWPASWWPLSLPSGPGGVGTVHPSPWAPPGVPRLRS